MGLRNTMLAAALGLVSLQAAAQQQVNVICPMAAEWCNMAAKEFEKATGINLARPEYAGDVQMANPNASGTAYTTIATLVQIFGEEPAFAMLKAWHKNISNYSRQGVGPIKATARGENMVAIAFIHDVVTEATAGFLVKSVAPCEGTGYEIGSMSIVKGARNLDNAQKFYDWALTPAAQKLSYESKSSFQLPSNVNTPGSPLSPKPVDIKVIDYKFPKYGSAAERKRLLERSDREVGRAAQ